MTKPNYEAPITKVVYKLPQTSNNLILTATILSRLKADPFKGVYLSDMVID